MNATGPRTYLAYGNFRFLKIAAAYLLVSVLVYWIHEPESGPSGGSWLGYTYGGLAALAIVWLMWFGIRKRSYSSRGAPLQAWLSAHVYLGLVLLVIVPLHSAFEFGWNVHTLAYVLMSLVVLTGIAGVQLYAMVPAQMTRNRPGQKLDSLLQQIADIDSDCRVQAASLPDALAARVAASIENTPIGGGLVRQLSGREPNCPTQLAIDLFKQDAQNDSLPREQQLQAKRILGLLNSKNALLTRVRRDLRYKARLDLWLIVHVPLAFATLIAVAVHVFVVFYYW